MSEPNDDGVYVAGKIRSQVESVLTKVKVPAPRFT